MCSAQSPIPPIVPDPVGNAKALGLPQVPVQGNPAPTPASTPAVVTAPLPGNWAGLGAGYNPAGSPKATGWASFATIISQSQKIYSYTTYDAVPQKNAVPVTSARTGFATVVRTFGPRLYLLAFGTAGVSQTATATQGTFSGGGMLFYVFSAGWTIEAGVRGASGSLASNPIAEVGFGRAW